MKTILAIFLLIFGNGKTFFSEHFQESKHFSVQLVGTEYYSEGECASQNNNSVTVRILFKTDYEEITKLTIVHQWGNNITFTVPVKHTDYWGNIVYTFCANKTAIYRYSTVFVNESGEKSNVISFKIDPQNAYISDGKPPKLLNVY